MGQPVKISDGLMLDARLMGEAEQRSIAGQIEFWAQLGRALEPLLRGETALRLKQLGTTATLSSRLAEVGTATGASRLRSYLDARPYPHFEAAPGQRGLLVKIEADGTKTIGRFVNRQFRPATRQR